MSDSSNAFFFGFATGAVTLAFLLIICGLTPKVITKEQRQEAVAAGVAEWIIETNESGEPEMKFQWKQLK